MSILIWSAIGSFAAFVVGIYLLAAAPRRAYDYAVCAKCKYNLSGDPAVSTCPECGAALNEFRIIPAGNNRKRGNFFAFGILLLISCPVIALAGIGAFINWFFDQWGK